MLLRVLIGVACVAVIGFVGYFAVGEYQTYAASQAAMAAREAADCRRYIEGSDKLMNARMSGIDQPPELVHQRARECRASSE